MSIQLFSQLPMLSI